MRTGLSVLQVAARMRPLVAGRRADEQAQAQQRPHAQRQLSAGSCTVDSLQPPAHTASRDVQVVQLQAFRRTLQRAAGVQTLHIVAYTHAVT